MQKRVSKALTLSISATVNYFNIHMNPQDDKYIPQTFRSLSKGNPGAMHFLCELIMPGIPFRTVNKVENSGIVGADLYVLWSDICEKDMKKVVQLMDDCPLPLLKDACSRQDYSGKEMVAQYFEQ